MTAPVDTGFLVYNERTYPHLKGLFATLGVETAPSDMSFSVRIGDGELEWAGTNLASVFAQPSNLFRPRFLRMLADLQAWPDWQTAVGYGAAGTVIVLAIAYHRLRTQCRQLTTALDHMQQGLCLYDGTERLRM